MQLQCYTSMAVKVTGIIHLVFVNLLNSNCCARECVSVCTRILIYVYSVTHLMYGSNNYMKFCYYGILLYSQNICDLVAENMAWLPFPKICF